MNVKVDLDATAAAVWAEVLECEPPGDAANFFELGGDSLAAMRVVGRIAEEMGCEVPVRSLFEHPTFGRFTDWLRALQQLPSEGEALDEVQSAGSQQVPLSFSQEGLLFLEHAGLAGSAYNVPLVLRLRGNLDARALGAAFAELLERHQAFRTRFVLSDSGPCQIVSDSCDARIETVDLTSAGEAHARTRARDLMQKHALDRFDLERGPMIRALLVRIAVDEYLLLITTHHIVSDGWSLHGVLIPELCALYSRNAGHSAAVPPLPRLGHTDFALSQRLRLRGDRLEENTRYWSERLRGAPPLLELPTDWPRPPIASTRGAGWSFRASRATYMKLRELALEEGATMFMVVLAAFQALLARWSGQSDIVVSSPIAGRRRPEHEHIIGFLANALALRTDLSGDPTFRQLLRRVRQTCLEAYAHSEMPLERLVAGLQPRRDLAYQPLMQTSLSFQSFPRKLLALPEIQMTWVDDEPMTSKLDLSLYVHEEDEGLRCVCEYATDLFRESTVARFCENFTRILDAVAEDADRSIHSGRFAGDSRDQQATVAHVGAVRQADLRYMHHLFSERAAAAPTAVAVTCGSDSLTYGELEERSNRLAHYLIDRGVGPEIVIGLYLERSVQSVVAVLATLKSGGAFLALDPDCPRARLQFMMEEANVALTLANSPLAGELPAGYGQIVCLDEIAAELAGSSARVPQIAVAHGNLAYVIFTSGSTGRPKGVLLEHGALANLALAQAHAFDPGPQDRVLQFARHTFDASVWEMALALCNGATLCMRPADADEAGHSLAALLCEERITIATLPPSVLAALGQLECPCLTQLIVAGEACSAALARQWSGKRRFINAYGPTETTVCASFGDYQGGARVPLGTAICNTRLHVLDENLQPVPPGVVGQLYVAGAALARGYVRRPGLTAERFVADPLATAGERMYRTGDRVRRDEEGHLEFLGRDDGQVKLHGHRIEVGEIEAALLEHPEVDQAVVAVREVVPPNPELIAYVVAAATASRAPHALREALGRTLPDYMIPRRFVFLPALPLTANGKVDRRALPEPAAEGAAREYAPPRTGIERMLAAIWSSVLRLDRVGVNDNFFDLGGDSIFALRVQSEAQRLGCHFSLLQLLQQPTIGGLAQSVVLDSSSYAPPTAAFALISAADAERARQAGHDDAYPLSRLQLGMLFHSQWQQGAKTYHAVTSHRLRLRLDACRLEEVISSLVRRHDVLRTTFHLSGFDEPLQCVRANATVPVRHVDWSSLGEAQQQAQLTEFLEEEKQRGFAFDTEPLIRFFTHRLGEDSFQLTMSSHHAILDGWSDGLLLSALYQGYVRALDGTAPQPLAPLPIAYRDFIAAERRALENPDHEKYWSRRVVALDEANHRFLGKRAQSGGGRDVSECIREALTAELCAAVAGFARRAGVPPKSVYFAAHLQTLRVVTGQEAVVSGLVTNARPECACGDEVLGLFLNTVPIQLSVAEGNWMELAQLAFALEQEALQHRDYPVVEVLSRHGGRDAIEVMFDYVNPRAYDELKGQIAIEEVKTFAHTNFALALCVLADAFAGTREVLLSFHGSRVSAQDASRLLQLYVRVLEQMTVNPSGLGATEAFLGADDRTALTRQNSTGVSYAGACLLPHMFAERAASAPGALALASAAASMSYAELDARSNQLANFLCACGVGPEVVVGVCPERPDAMVIAFLAVLKAGGAFLPLDPSLPRQRLALMLDETGTSLLLAQPGVLDALPSFAGLLVDLDARAQDIGRQSAVAPQTRIRPANIAYIIYTSGSTGVPKGTLVTHGGLANLVRAVGTAIGVKPTDRVLQFAPWSFDASVWELGTTLCAGATLCLTERIRGGHAELADVLRQFEITMVTLPPSALRSLGDEGFPSIQTVVVAGEACPLELAALWSSRCRFIDAYGPTEATICATQGALSPVNTRVHVGCPLPNVTCHILTPNLLAVPLDTVGELFIGGAGVARGYLRRPGLTASRFVASPFGWGERLYRTGDLARRRADGTIEYLGRTDRQVKVRGHRIEIGEIEAALRGCSSVAQVAVLAVERAGGDLGLTAYVAGRSGGPEPDAKELRTELGARLPDYMIPALFVTLQALPLTAAGKVDYAALPAPDGQRLDVGAFCEPQTSLQSALAVVWAEVLEIDRVGIRDDFFALGGHSLIATRVVAWVREALDMDLPVKALFDFPTIEALSEQIENVRWLRGETQPAHVTGALSAQAPAQIALQA